MGNVIERNDEAARKRGKIKIKWWNEAVDREPTITNTLKVKG